MMAKITAIIYAKNEEKLLPGLLRNISSAVDEILVLDGKSTDATVEIAKKMGARVVTRRKQDLVRTSEYCTNYYMEKYARNYWILGLDADERLEPAALRALPKLIANPRYKAYRFRRKNYVSPNVWWKHGTYYPNYQLRLFDKRYARFRKPIHVEPEVEGQVRNLELDMVHLKYLRDGRRIMAQHNEFAGGEDEVIQNQLVFALLYMPVFCYFFFFKLGILEPGCWRDLALKRVVYYTRYPSHMKGMAARILSKVGIGK